MLEDDGTLTLGFGTAETGLASRSVHHHRRVGLKMGPLDFCGESGGDVPANCKVGHQETLATPIDTCTYQLMVLLLNYMHLELT